MLLRHIHNNFIDNIEIESHFRLSRIEVAAFLIFYIDKKFKSIGKDESQITDQFAVIGELFSDSDKNIKELRDKLSETKSALETTYQNSQKEVTKSLNEFNLIFRSSQERGSLGEYRVEQLLENLGLRRGITSLAHRRKLKNLEPKAKTGFSQVNFHRRLRDK